MQQMNETIKVQRHAVNSAILCNRLIVLIVCEQRNSTDIEGAIQRTNGQKKQKDKDALRTV